MTDPIMSAKTTALISLNGDIAVRTEFGSNTYEGVFRFGESEDIRLYVNESALRKILVEGEKLLKRLVEEREAREISGHTPKRH